MILSNLDLALQERVLLSIHKGCTIGEAREKENTQGAYTNNGFFLVDEDLFYHKGGYNGEDYEDSSIEDISYLSYPNYDDSGNKTGDMVEEGIIGLPPCLARTLVMLNQKLSFPHQSGYIYFDSEIYYISFYDDGDAYDFHVDRRHVCSWKELDNLRDQEESTKQAIAKEIGISQTL